MIDKEILTKAIDKAISNGYSGGKIAKIFLEEFGNSPNYTARAIAFSHKFAKAFWGEICVGMPVFSIHHPDVAFITEIVDEYSVKTTWKQENPRGQLISDLTYTHLGWQYHLQQMVLEEKPLKYLEKFL